jgi:uncharacterized protein (TIGR02453 family)
MPKIPLMDVDIYPPFEGFPKEGINFLKKLKRNNKREWFEKHKEEYEHCVKTPMLSFIASLQPFFARFAPEFDLNPKRSIFRIYRDIRFSPDKTPYKTHIAAHFVLRGMPKGFIGSGYYIQIEPGELFVGGGIYLPDSNQLKKIRAGIAQHGDKFLAIIKNRKFTKRFLPFEWAKLQRVPQGYNENHPMAEWLKCKQFFVGISLPEARCYRESFVADVGGVCEEAAPLVIFLNNCLT